MSRDFFNNTEAEFDEGRHLSSREVWEGLAKHLLVNFNDIISRIELDYQLRLLGFAEAEMNTKEMGTNLDPRAVKAEKEVIDQKLKLIHEYERVALAEQEAMAFRNKKPKEFLEKRKGLTWEQEKMVGAFKDEIIEEILGAFKKLAGSGSQELSKIETHFEAGDGGILPTRKETKMTKEIHPEFLRTLNESSLGANVLNEGFFKLLKQEREIIDDRLCGGKKERPY